MSNEKGTEVDVLLNNLIVSVTDNDFSKDEIKRVTHFIVSVFSLFADYNKDILKDNYFKTQCRLYAKEIKAMSRVEYFNRLQRVKRIIAWPNFKGLNGNYKNPNGALACACSKEKLLDHDYYLIYPPVNESVTVKLSDGSIEKLGTVSAEIRKSLEIPRDEELAKQQLKDLHDFMNSKIGKIDEQRQTGEN